MHSNANSNPSNEIRSIPIDILAIEKGFEAFVCKLNQSQGIRSNQVQIQTLQTKFEPFERDLKYSNANSNHSKGIRSR